MARFDTILNGVYEFNSDMPSGYRNFASSYILYPRYKPTLLSCVCMQYYLQNYQLKLQQEVHYKTLVQSSRKYEEEQDKAEVVEKDEVEQALTEKLKLARQFAQQLRGRSIL